MAARAAVRALLGGGGEDRWATASDGEDGGGYERCPLRRRTARAERAIKFATPATELCASPPKDSRKIASVGRFDELVEKSKGRRLIAVERVTPEKWDHPDNRPELLTELQNLF